MAHKTLINGTGYELKSGRVLIGGTGYGIKKGRTLIDGTGYDIKFATPLGELDEGTLVKLNEDGSPVGFYVAKHDYESDLNGTGRTLMVRKDCYDARMYGDSSMVSYPSATIDDWCIDTYLPLLDSDIQAAISTTEFYVSLDNAPFRHTIERAVWHLSINEVFEPGGSKADGSLLPIADTLKIAYYNGSAVPQWTRTDVENNSIHVYIITAAGEKSFSKPNSTGKYSRPVFTLPAEIEVDSDFNIIIPA